MAENYNLIDRYDLWELLAQTQESLTLDSAVAAIDRLVRRCGFDYFIVMTSLHQVGGPSLHVDFSVPAIRKATTIYTDLEMAKQDPVAKQLFGGQSVIDATRLIYEPESSQDGRGFVPVSKLLRAHGIGAHGLSVFGGDDGVAVNAIAAGYRNRSDVDDFPRRMAGAAWMLRIAANALRNTLVAAPEAYYSFPLTTSELAALRRLARGERPREIALSVGKALPTVRKQLDSARRRLRANTLNEAIARAALLGLIDTTGQGKP
ncbi:MAG: helix-turn-helix transcriptional regulator [Pseudomonadota bacterium]